MLIKSGCLKEIFKINPKPGRPRLIIYLAMPLLTALSAYFSLHSDIPVNNTWLVLLLVFFILVFFDPFLKPYLYSKLTVKKLIGGILGLFFITWSVSALSDIVLAPLIGRDPQGLHNISLTASGFINRTPVLFFRVAGEEYLKIVMFLGLLAVIKWPKGGRVLIAILVSSLIFALLHVLNWNAAAVIPITIITVPYFLWFLYYRNIIILIAVHFLFDQLSYLYRIKSNGPQLYEYTLAALICFSIAYLCFCFVTDIKKRTAKK